MSSTGSICFYGASMTFYGKRMPTKKLTKKDRVALRKHAARARRVLKFRG